MKLSTPEIALLREVFRHARKKGWTRMRDKDTVATWWDYDGSSVITLERFDRDLVLDINSMTRLDVISLKYAVDVLAAAGVLPARFSSFYRRPCVCGHMHGGACPECTCTSYQAVTR